MKTYEIVINTNQVPFQTGVYITVATVKANSHKQAREEWIAQKKGELSTAKVLVDMSGFWDSPFKTVLNY